MPKRYLAHKSLRPLLGRVALDPIETQQKIEGAGGLYSQFQDTRAFVGQANRQLRSDFLLQRSDARRGARDAIQSLYGDALDRGTVGSSTSVLGKGQIAADRASQVSQARSAMVSGQMSNITQLMQARRDYQTGLMNLAAMEAAAKQNKALAKVMEGWNLGGGGGGAGGGVGGGRGGGMGGPGGGGGIGPGGGPAGPKGPQGFLGTGGTLAQLSQADIASMGRKRQGKVAEVATDRLKDIFKKWEGKGFNVFWGEDGKLYRAADDPRANADPTLMKRGTRLDKRRDWAKKLYAQQGRRK